MINVKLLRIPLILADPKTAMIFVRIMTVALVLGCWSSVFPNYNCAESNDTITRDYAFLERGNISPTPEGALAHLRGFIPKKLSRADIEAMLNRLGHANFRERELAVEALVRTPNFPTADLLAASKADDLEIRWRANWVIEQRGRRDWRSLHAALRVLAVDPPAETFAVVLELSAYYPEESNQYLLHKVLAQLAREEHWELLRSAAKDESPGKRLAAAVACHALRPIESGDWFANLTENTPENVALIAAKRLGNMGERRAVAPLVRLAQSDDRQIAEESLCFLRLLTEIDFRLPARNDLTERTVFTAKLNQWLRTEAGSIVLRFPVLESAIQRGDLAGNTLISTGSMGRIVEVTSAGKEVWSFAAQAWSAEKLRKGTVLVASYASNQLQEVDAAGRVVWKLDGINAMRAKPLADDHILVAVFSGNRVLELNELRQEIWSQPTPDNCFDAERLPNGNTVFACPNLVREISPEGATIRSLEIEGRVNSLQLLPNGDWLVANYGKNQIQQYDRQGKLAWSFTETQPNDAFRQKDGHTLVTSGTRCVEVDAAGQILRTLQQTNYGSARR